MIESNDTESSEAEHVQLQNYMNREMLTDTSTEKNKMASSKENASEITEVNITETSTSAVKRKSLTNLDVEDTSANGISANIPKKRRYTELQEAAADSIENVIPTENENICYTLTVKNTPGEWSPQDVVDFMIESCGVTYEAIIDDRSENNANFEIQLKSKNKDQVEGIYEKLKNLQDNGKLTVTLDASATNLENLNAPERNTDNTSNETIKEETMTRDTESNNGPVIEEIENDDGTENRSPSSVLDFEADDNAFYLRDDFLESLGIKKPITNWVTVTNFRCDKPELKDVLELAGNVLVCSVININMKYANVMYSHPLEAVQAISMLNGQKMYGLPLKLTMNNSKNMNIILPKGLATVGPGLGKCGKRIPDLPEQFKRMINGQKSTIETTIFQEKISRISGRPLQREPSSLRSANVPNNQDNYSEYSFASRADDPDVQTPIFHNNSVTQLEMLTNMGSNQLNLREELRNMNADINNQIIYNLDMIRSMINSLGRTSFISPVAFSEVTSTSRFTVPINVGPNPMNIGPVSNARCPTPAPIRNIGPDVGQRAHFLQGAQQEPQVPMQRPQAPIQGLQVPMQGPQVPLQMSQMPLQSQGLHVQMQGPQVIGLGPHIQLQGSQVPGQGPQVPGQGPQVPGQGPQVPIQGLQVPVQGIQVPLQVPHVQLQGSQLPGQGPHVQMQGQQNPGPGSHGQLQGQQIPGPGPHGQLQGQQISGQGPRIQLQGPRISGPGLHVQQLQGPQVPGQGPHVQLQGPQVPGQGSHVQLQGPQVPGQGPHIQLQGPQVPGQGPQVQQQSGVLLQRPQVPIQGVQVPLRMPQGPPSSNVQMFQGQDPQTLQISNLPQTTNFMYLGQRLSEFGTVVFLQLTTPGCAVVRFGNIADAERCLQNYRRVLA